MTSWYHPETTAKRSSYLLLANICCPNGLITYLNCSVFWNAHLTIVGSYRHWIFMAWNGWLQTEPSNFHDIWHCRDLPWAVQRHQLVIGSLKRHFIMAITTVCLILQQFPCSSLIYNKNHHFSPEIRIVLIRVTFPPTLMCARNVSPSLFCCRIVLINGNFLRQHNGRGQTFP